MRSAGHYSPAAALRYQFAAEDRDKAITNALDQMLRGDVVPMSKPDPLRPQRSETPKSPRGEVCEPGESSGRSGTLNLAGPPGTSVPTGHNSN
jgi:hypothetical protein